MVFNFCIKILTCPFYILINYLMIWEVVSDDQWPREMGSKCKDDIG